MTSPSPSSRKVTFDASANFYSFRFDFYLGIDFSVQFYCFFNSRVFIFNFPFHLGVFWLFLLIMRIEFEQDRMQSAAERTGGVGIESTGWI